FKQTNAKSAYISLDNSLNSTSNTLLNIAADTGTLTHLYMEMIANSGLAAWPVSRIQACAQAMQHWFKQKGHASEIIEPFVTAVINALTKSVESTDCAWLLGDRNSRQSELSITTLDAFGAPQEQRLDLTFIEEDAQKRWLIDYKLTFSDDVADLALLAEQHRPQLSRYAALFEQEGLPIQTAVFFLTYGKLILL
ncbi:MAG: exodeoxyribonuclease V, partial [Methylotenera sp.]